MKSWNSSHHDDEERAFIQLRVAGFGLSAGSLFLAFWVFIVARRWVVDAPSLFTRVSLLHLGASLCFLLSWLICRQGRRPMPVIRGVEMGSVFLGCALFCLMSLDIGLEESPGLVLTSVMGVALTARAVFVPSSFLRSLILAYAVGVPIAGAVYANFVQIDRAEWLSRFPDIMSQSPESIARSSTVAIAAWWLVPATLTGLASKVIYGLRREVREAKQYGQYHLVRKLGEGGMGKVYEARHRLLRRRTALKLIEPSAEEGTQLARFEREVQLTASLVHPNVISVFDFGHTQDGTFYYAMELIQGATLAELVAVDGPQDPARVVHLVHQAASALVEAHAAGMVHRDIKPANLMVHSAPGVRDILKVLDFGLVKDVSGAPSDLSRSSVISGTPHYLSPEAIQNPRAVGPASDIYALGCVAYYLLTGCELFEGETVIQVCADHLHTTPPRPSERLGRPLPVELEELVMQCLKKDPEQRPRSIEVLGAALAAVPIPRWSNEDAAGWWEVYGSKMTVQRGRASRTDLMSIEVARSS